VEVEELVEEGEEEIGKDGVLESLVWVVLF